MIERHGYVVEYATRGGGRARMIVWATSAGEALRRAQLERHWCSALSFRMITSEVFTSSTRAGVTPDTPSQ
jgi:hypothetical protein